MNTNTLKELSVTDPAICPNLCGHSYKGKSRKAHLKRHLIYECGVPKQFQCDMCLKKFCYNTSLQKHYVVCTKSVLASYDNDCNNFLAFWKSDKKLIYNQILELRNLNIVILLFFFMLDSQLILYGNLYLRIINYIII